jgi:hypothetical protein
MNETVFSIKHLTSTKLAVFISHMILKAHSRSLFGVPLHLGREDRLHSDLQIEVNYYTY